MSLGETRALSSQVGPEGNLCALCQEDDYESYFWKRGDRSWTVSELLTFKASCSFCSLVYETAKLNSDGTISPTRDHVSINGFTVYDGLGNPCNGRALSTRSGNAIETPYCVARKPNNAARGLVKSRADFALFAEWLSVCETKHTFRCERIPSIPPYPGFRVIDVRARCVVHPTSACRYVALSYFTLKKDNHELLQQPNSISPQRADISRTALDAIEVCRAMGLRYLWVDALCIVQDDASDKAGQIPHMDQVYRNAVLTIVAAAGPHCNSGLPGIQPRSVVQHVATVKGCEFTSAPQCVCHLMRSSTWDGRRWTLQEKLLSRRLLVFTERLIFFRCKQSIFREDLGPEEISGSTTGPRDLYGDFPGVGTSVSVHFPLLCWFQLIEDYLHRNLSVDDDILDAFDGILTVLTPVIGPFIFGMPSSSALGNTLLWQDTPPQRRPAYPSWSWAGWVFPHALESPGHSYMNRPRDYNISSAVKFYGFSSNAVVPISVKYSNELGVLPGLRHHLEDQDVSLDHVQQYLKLPGVDQSHLLFFWSSCVKFPLSDVEPRADRDSTKPWPFYLSTLGARPWDVTQEAENPFIWVRQEWLNQKERDLELVLICVDYWGYDAQFMLVEWKGGIAYRVDAPTIQADENISMALARISASTWLSMKPTRKLIALG